jgi:hypothetical protein
MITSHPCRYEYDDYEYSYWVYDDDADAPTTDAQVTATTATPVRSGANDDNLIDKEVGTTVKHDAAETTLNESGCTVDVSIDYFGGDIPGVNMISANTADECAFMCSENSLCLYYTFGYEMCHFKSNNAGRVYKFGSTSGSCNAVSETEARAKKYQFICEVNESGFDFHGADLATQYGVQTADECGMWCEDTEGCSHFTYVNHICYMKTNGNGRYPNEASVSGSCAWMAGDIDESDQDDSCIFANDDKCDEFPVCETGTDQSDCNSGSLGVEDASGCLASRMRYFFCITL